MLKFFRKIRQKIISENNFRKYLLYAIGEILLVVIGILIALQLNNLNEAKKERVYEVKMLKEVKLALEQDIKNFKGMVKRLKEVNSAVKDFTSLAHSDYDIKDSLLLKPFNEKKWGNLRTGVDYRINFGPYEAIKSSGMDKISNDSVRNLLINFYDYELPSFVEITLWYARGFEQTLEKQNSFLEDPVVHEEEGQLKIVKNIPGDLYKRPEWIELIKDIGDRTYWISNRLNSEIPKMQIVVEQLENEIKE